MSDTQDKRILTDIDLNPMYGGIDPKYVIKDELPPKPVKHPKTREEWKDRRDWCLSQGNKHEAEWIDRKILYPIGNIINGKYPDDEKFECKCGSHVGVRQGGIFDNTTECVVCGQGVGFYIGLSAREPWSE